MICNGIIYGLESSIKTKLVTIGAISREKAATSQEAQLSIQEQNWLGYIAGGMFAKVKKTGKGRFYAASGT